MPATLSIMGLYNYDNTLFDLLQLPTGVDKDTLIDNLVSQLSENEVLYPNNVVMKSLIGIWSHKRIDVWERLYKTTRLEYDPISNYDRKEEWSDKRTTNNTSSNTQNDTAEKTSTESDSVDKTVTVSGSGESSVTNTESGSNVNTRKVAGYDSDVTGTDYVDDATNTMQTSGTGTGKSTETTTDKTTNTRNATEKATHSSNGTNTSNGSDNLTRSGRAYGNIGVTTTQQMIIAEREVSEFNIYDYIISDFKHRFCLMVY